MDITQHVKAIALHVNIISFNILIHYLQTDSDVPVSSDVVPLPPTFPQVPPVGTTTMTSVLFSCPPIPAVVTTMTPPSVSTINIHVITMYIDITQHVKAIALHVNIISFNILNHYLQTDSDGYHLQHSNKRHVSKYMLNYIHYLQTNSDGPVSSDVVPPPPTLPAVVTTMPPPSVSTNNILYVPSILQQLAAGPA
jgi:hypothetical protein